MQNFLDYGPLKLVRRLDRKNAKGLVVKSRLLVRYCHMTEPCKGLDSYSYSVLLFPVSKKIHKL